MSFPDVTGLLIGYLTAELGVSTPVRSTRSDPLPNRWVQVRPIGGSVLPPVRIRPRLDIWAWGTDEADAMTLGGDVRGLIWALSGNEKLGAVCYRVEEAMSLRLNEDPFTNAARSWATYQLTIRADSVIEPAP